MLFWLIYLLNLFALICLSNETSYFVQCGQCLNKRIRNALNSSCIVEHIDELEYSEHNVTAPVANWEDTTSWYVFTDRDQNFRGIALNLTWSQLGSDFLLTDGYILTISRTRSSFSNLRKVVVNLSYKIDPDDIVYINYPCYGKDFNSNVYLNYDYPLVLNSMPLYRMNSKNEANEAEKTIFVNCNDYNQINSKMCTDYSGDLDYSDDEDGFNEDKNRINEEASSKANVHQSLDIFIAVITTTSIFFLVMAILCYLYCFKKRLFSKPQSIILLASVLDEDDRRYWDAVDQLGDILKTYGKLDVESVLWNLTKTDHIEWLNDKLKDHCHVVLVCTPTGLRNWKNFKDADPFVMGINMFIQEKRKENLLFRKTRKFSAIYFDNDPSNCVPAKILCHKPVNIGLHFDSFFFSTTGIKLKQHEHQPNVIKFQKLIKHIQSQAKEEMRLVIDVA